MGSISSVYVGTNHRESSESNEGNIEAVDEENPVSLIGASVIGNRNLCRENVLRVQLNHSLNVAPGSLLQSPEHRRDNLGITVQYLAEENVRLMLVNKQLTEEMKRLTRNTNYQSIDTDRDTIYGETTEQKLRRLERHLASERREKWSAIENSERTRVDLVNCERELAKSNKTIEMLTKELESRKIHSETIGTSERLISHTSEEDREMLSKMQESRRESMDNFRADLKAKREARQRALSAISTELNSLKEELKKEKLVRQELEKELEIRRGAISEESAETIINSSLKNEINILTENIESLKDLSKENIRLKVEISNLNQEMDALNSSLGELKLEYYEEKRKHEETLQKLKDLENEKKDKGESSTSWEEEKEKIFEKYDLEKEEINKRTNALKEVISITRQMLTIRESQVKELKTKLKDIEESVKNSKFVKESGLREEYEKQLENIKNLKELYDERIRLMEAEREKLLENLQDKMNKIKYQEDEIERLNKEIDSYHEEVKNEKHEKENMERELRLTIARTKDLENELNLINNMFTQMLLGPYNTGNETDLDKLTELLQENHDLITEMTTREDSSEIASVLPKLLLDLITQVDGINEKKDDDALDIESNDTISEQSESLLEGNQGAVLPILSYKNATLFKPPVSEDGVKSEEAKTSEGTKPNEQVSPAVQEIVSNLPKVWKVLTELLSHHSVPEEPTPGDEKQCYKNIETPNGPRSVISVSKTFIRLKDLILEKKGLQKELTRLKQLNSHLESRLDDQEKRLSQVQCELHKTWGIVGRMRAQHQQLHNHEKILRYELQEKRVMLCELKQELEYCREKWERARQKNDESETEWKKLRREFAARKSKGYLLSNLNDSGESGFSDEQNESGEDCENFDADRSSTQSPVDQNFIREEAREEQAKVETCSSESQQPGTVEGIIQKSESNLEQTSESAENTVSEQISDTATASGSTPKVQTIQVGSQEEERARAREARELRLKRLEEQCKLLVRQVDITTHKSNYLNNRLEELHDQYGGSEDNRTSSSHARTSEGESSSSVVPPQQEEASSSRPEGEQSRTEDNKSERTAKDNNCN